MNPPQDMNAPTAKQVDRAKALALGSTICRSNVDEFQRAAKILRAVYLEDPSVHNPLFIIQRGLETLKSPCDKGVYFADPVGRTH